MRSGARPSAPGEGEEGIGGGLFIAATQIGSGVILAITASLFAAGMVGVVSGETKTCPDQRRHPPPKITYFG